MRFAIVLLPVFAAAVAGQPARSFTAEDRAAAAAVTQAYVKAWLSNDAERVMATLTGDAVLLPSGMRPIEGAGAIRRFWFPADGPTTRVTAMALTVDEIRGGGDIAIVRGRGTLTFTMPLAGGGLETRTQESWYVNVLQRQADGRWLIWRRMWSDLRR